MLSFVENLQNIAPPGNSFNPQISKDVFFSPFIEDPLLVCEFFEATLKQQEEANKNKTKKEINEVLLASSAKLLEMVTLRHRLISACLETEVLAKIYRMHANEMGYEDFHMFMRYVQFDFAKYKENAGQPPPVFVNDLSADDSTIDRYVPNSLCLAAQEVDEGQIGRVSFKSKENVQQVIIKVYLFFIQVLLYRFSNNKLFF